MGGSAQTRENRASVGSHAFLDAAIVAVSALLSVGRTEVPVDSSRARQFDTPPSGTVALSTVPARPRNAITGSQFARRTADMDGRDRQQAARRELLRGNTPGFMRVLHPVCFTYGTDTTACVRAVIWASADYLSIGSDHDFLRIPLSLPVATEVLDQFACILPTRKMVDTIYNRATVHLKPQPMRPCPAMRGSGYFLKHQRMIERQRGDDPITRIIAGHKKDVVLTNLLWHRKGRIAIYGWHLDDETPIQPLSTVHGRNYADYSHGVRLVRDSVWIDGRLLDIYEVLRDSTLAPILTYENVIADPAHMMGKQRNAMVE